MFCLFGHKWNGCKCERCGKIRDEGHDFQEQSEPDLSQYKLEPGWSAHVHLRTCSRCHSIEVSYSKTIRETCQSCNGAGKHWYDPNWNSPSSPVETPCEECGGTGYISMPVSETRIHKPRR